MSENAGNTVRYKAKDLPPTSPEDLARLRAIRDEDIDFSDIPPIDPNAPIHRSRTVRIEEELLAWLDKQPKPNKLINDLLRAYRAAVDAGQDGPAVAATISRLVDLLTQKRAG